jgi:hypothetical protein
MSARIDDCGIQSLRKRDSSVEVLQRRLDGMACVWTLALGR